MKKRPVSARIMALAVSSPAVLFCVAAAGMIMKVGNGRIGGIEDIVGDLNSASIVFVGELHDQKEHHRAQLSVIRAMQEAGASMAIGMEMFLSEHQEDLNRWIAGETDEEEFIPAYYHNWNFPWPLYRDIFLFARENKIPMIGLNVSPEITRQVARSGFNSLDPEQLKRLPGVRCQVDKAYEEFIRRALGDESHAASSFKNFCEAQMVWDTMMAHRLLEYRKQNPGRKIVVLAGSGHSWKKGIPAQIEKAGNTPYRVILPEIPGRLEPEAVTTDEADYLWLGTTRIESRNSCLSACKTPGVKSHVPALKAGYAELVFTGHSRTVAACQGGCSIGGSTRHLVHLHKALF